MHSALTEDEGHLSKRKRGNKFSNILLESIDQAFTVLGEKAKTSIYIQLETKFAIPRNDIPKRVGDFSDALEQIFGLAAPQLEILIMKYLNQKVNCAYDWVGPKWLVPDLTLTKYIKLLEMWCEKNEKTWELEVMINAEERQEQSTQ
jgi:hypothetical protein